MAYKRADRVNALLQRELGTLISEELRDPRIAFTTVTSVEITDDLRSARVYVSVLGDDDAAKMQRVAEILVSALPREQLDRLLDEWDERMGAALRPLELSDRPSG